MDNCGPNRDKWDRQRVDGKIKSAGAANTAFVLPLATIIETGNHIAQATHSRKEQGSALADLMRKSAEAQTPWAAFSDQSALGSAENLKSLADSWPDLAAQKLSLGAATIKDIAEYYARLVFAVEILTGNQGLKSHEPSTPVQIPRRRQRQGF
jgi:hypothetical protein